MFFHHDDLFSILRQNASHRRRVRSETLRALQASATRRPESPEVITRANAMTPARFGLLPANRTDLGVNRLRQRLQQSECRSPNSSGISWAACGRRILRDQFPQTRLPSLQNGQDFPQCSWASLRSIQTSDDKKLALSNSLRHSTVRTFFVLAHK